MKTTINNVVGFQSVTIELNIFELHALSSLQHDLMKSMEETKLQYHKSQNIDTLDKLIKQQNVFMSKIIQDVPSTQDVDAELFTNNTNH